MRVDIGDGEQNEKIFNQVKLAHGHLIDGGRRLCNFGTRGIFGGFGLATALSSGGVSGGKRRHFESVAVVDHHVVGHHLPASLDWFRYFGGGRSDRGRVELHGCGTG